MHWLLAAKKKKRLHQRLRLWPRQRLHQLQLLLHLLQKPLLVPLLQLQLQLALPCRHLPLLMHPKMPPALLPVLLPTLPRRLLMLPPLPLHQRSNFLNCCKAAKLP